MSAFLAALHLDDPASLKRALVALFGTVVVLASPFLQAHGIPVPSTEAQLALCGVLASFILQSGAKSAVVAHAEAIAATPVPSVEAAAKSLTEAVEAGK